MCAIDMTRQRSEQLMLAGALADRYRAVRAASERLCEPLEPEDCVIQSMPDVSPTRWHLAHTTWFFETLVLAKSPLGHEPFDPAYEYLFNSYYNTVGEQFPRPRRGLLSRPTVAEVFSYRRHVDRAMQELFGRRDDAAAALAAVIEVGLHHEQQHQELILSDIKHVFSCNPLYPAYGKTPAAPSRDAAPLEWIGYDEGLQEIGHGGAGFAYDSETPRHRVFIESFELASRPVTNGEYIDFIEDGGYRRPEFWLSDGWLTVQKQRWTAPLYWVEHDGGWRQFTLSGLRPLNRAEPVCHVSLFEADAFARWAGARLPREAESELASESVPIEGNFVEDAALHPRPAAATFDGRPQQMFGDVWEWTASQYSPYPGYQRLEGALGEYNGKFMCNQFVLRGGSCVTSKDHIRRTYRNFFPPEARWQFSGLRLAR